MSTTQWAGNWLTRAVASEAPARSVDPSLTLGVLFVAAAIVSSLLVSSPGIGTADATVMLACAAAALLGGAALVRFRPPIAQPLVAASLVLGTTWMGADAFSLSSGGLLLCVWFAPAAFALVELAPAIVVAAYAVAVPGIILAATGELSTKSGSSAAAKQWVIVAAIIIAASAAVWALSRRTAERERALAAITSKLAVGIGVIGEGRRFLAVNPVLRALLGDTTGAIVGRQVESFTTADHAAEVRRAVDALLESSAPSSAFDLVVVRPDGEMLYTLVYAASIEPSPREPSFVIALVYDLSERRRIDEQRAELAALLVSAQEEERRRIASEVHDDPLQALIALSLELQILERRTKEELVLESIAGLKESIKQAIEQVRGLLFELHPPALELGGLSESLRELIRRYEASGGPEVAFENTIAREPTPEEAVALFRITAEALTNVRKHADATRVAVSVVDSQGGIALSVADDGVGMDGDATVVVPGHLGVASMRARAERAGGSLEISSRPGKGTTVRVWIPRQET
ncbi:MAG: ATP-binding protein [Acidimicrobiales bacterium]